MSLAFYFKIHIIHHIHHAVYDILPGFLFVQRDLSQRFELKGEGAFRFQTLADALDRVGILINLLKLRCASTKIPTHFLYAVLLFPE